MPYSHRSIETVITEATYSFPIVLLTGPRQVGKTTLLKELSDNSRKYISLDHPLVLELAQKDPALFLERFTPPLLIDEIQYAPQLLPYLKLFVDEHPNISGLFWLTGSQPFHLMKGVSESLAGRIAVFNLLGLSNEEIRNQALKARPFLPTLSFIQEQLSQHAPCSLKTFYARIWLGDFPDLVLYRKNRDLYYQSYVSTYLQRDIRDLARVGDEMMFLKFLRSLAARTAQIINLSEIARELGIATNTAKNWLSILQTSNLIYLLEPWHHNIHSRIIKSPKLYFLDTGLCSWLTEWNSPETLEAGAMSGAILETFVINELLKSYFNQGLRPPFYFYRDKDQREIDLIIHQDGQFYPLEIKKTANPNLKDIRHFMVLDPLKDQVAEGGILCFATEYLPLNAKNSIIPLSVL